VAAEPATLSRVAVTLTAGWNSIVTKAVERTGACTAAALGVALGTPTPQQTAQSNPGKVTSR